ncbi:MAG: glycine cleavage system protein GcvH [Lachnospiraceae bacterium]|nr:glycine cleavage system protein GcvH [Lachnospiraceae bacterium]MCD8098085.1 glycine cleavage system protein GcvH [Lachnospiraceae bacterium]
MNIPAELKYSKTHEWVKMLDETTALIGITDYAQDALGDVVFVDIPETGDAVTAGESFTDVESVKAVSEVISPVSGEIAEVNEALDEAPELLNQDCYESWIIKVSGITETEELLDAAAYEEYLKTCEEEE